MSSININGNSYIGSQVTIKNNKITINGVDVTPDTKVINITINGDIEDVQVDYCEKVVVNGNVKNLQTTSGDIECHDVQGDIKATSGDIECAGNVSGSIQTVSGDVKCETVGGSVKTLSGDIKYRK